MPPAQRVRRRRLRERRDAPRRATPSSSGSRRVELLGVRHRHRERRVDESLVPEAASPGAHDRGRGARHASARRTSRCGSSCSRLPRRSRERRVHEDEPASRASGCDGRERDRQRATHRVAHDDRRPALGLELREQVEVRAGRWGSRVSERVRPKPGRSSAVTRVPSSSARPWPTSSQFTVQPPRPWTSSTGPRPGRACAGSQSAVCTHVPSQSTQRSRIDWLPIPVRDPPVHRFDHPDDSSARSRPSPSSRSSCSCIQTVWYESMRGRAASRARPSSTRRRAPRNRSRYCAKRDTWRPRLRTTGPVCSSRVDQPVDHGPVVDRVRVVVRDPAGPHLPVGADLQQCPG